MKSIRLIFSAATFCCAVLLHASAPSGYYSSLNGKTEGELKDAVYNLVHNFTLVSSYNALPDYFRKTDGRPNTNQWWDMYSAIGRSLNSFSGLNREHSFPKSWWGGSTTVSAYVDLNHLYPADGPANMAKSNYPLGEVSKSTFDNGVTTVGYPVNGQGGGASQVFEPADQYKGDFARTYFYMVTCYQTLKWKYSYMLGQNTYPTLTPWAVNLLLKWHHEDPVSQKEVDRNEVIYSIQGNRNPFIDMPELADYIWGEKKGEPFVPGTVIVTPPATTTPELLNPPVEMSALQFGEVALGDQVVRQLYVKSSALTGAIDVTVYRDDAAMFVPAQTSIPASLPNGDNGYWLQITYTPTQIGDHQARVLLQGDFGSRGVAITGSCLPVPDLSQIKVLPPTDVTDTEYRANWEIPEGETIDYYVVTRTRYLTGSQPVTEEVVAENDYALMDGFNDSDSESYSVQSVRLGHRSPMSNVVFVNHAGVTGVEVDEPLVVQSFNGFIRFICSTPQTGCRVYDTAGRIVASLASVEQNYDLYLPTGFYLVVTDQHSCPVKAVVR